MRAIGIRALRVTRRVVARPCRWAGAGATAVLVGVVRLWQVLVSPTYGQTCRFYPSCSAYALEALQRHGAAKGSWLTLRRLARCHPWNPGGVDPVPPAGLAADGPGGRVDAGTTGGRTPQDTRTHPSGHDDVCTSERRSAA